MKALILISSVLISQLTFASSFYRFTPAPKVDIHGNLQKHRNDQLLYRGTSGAKISLEDAISAMFGKKNVYVQSTVFKKIVKEFEGKKYSTNNVTLTPHLQSRISELKRHYKTSKIKGELAEELAKGLCDEHFSRLSDHDILTRYIDYQSAGWLDWPNNVLFSTIIPQIAAKYGARVVAIEDNKKRSLDLGFWNWANNPEWYNADKWYGYKRDAGEFTTPCYYEGDEIVGYETRAVSKVRVKGTKAGGQEGLGLITGVGRIEKQYEKLEVAFYKVVYNDKPYVVVFDGQDEVNRLSYHSGISKVAPYQFYYSKVSEDKDRRRDLPPVLIGPAKALGFLSLCESPENCHIPAELKSHFRLSRYGLSSKLIKKVEKLTISGNKVKYLR